MHPTDFEISIRAGQNTVAAGVALIGDAATQSPDACRLVDDRAAASASATSLRDSCGWGATEHDGRTRRAGGDSLSSTCQKKGSSRRKVYRDCAMRRIDSDSATQGNTCRTTHAARPTDRCALLRTRGAA